MVYVKIIQYGCGMMMWIKREVRSHKAKEWNDEYMDDRLKDMFRDIGESSFKNAHIMILYVVIKTHIYIRDARVLHDCLRC